MCKADSHIHSRLFILTHCSHWQDSRLSPYSVVLAFSGLETDCSATWLQAGSLGAQLQEHSLKGPSPLTLHLPISKRVPLAGAELVAYQEQKRKEEMGALQRPAPQASDSALADPLPSKFRICLRHGQCLYSQRTDEKTDHTIDA